MEQRRSDGFVVEAKLGADLRRAPRMEHEVLARPALLALVGVGGEKKGPPDQVANDLRVVGGHGRDQLVDELLMLFVSLKDSHTLSVLRGYRAPSPTRGRDSREGTRVPMLKGSRSCTGTDAEKNAVPPYAPHDSSLRSTPSPDPAGSDHSGCAGRQSAPPARARSRMSRADRSHARGSAGRTSQ